MISFDTNVLVYATSSGNDVRARRARDLITRAMGAASTILLLRTLAEFSSVAARKAKIPVGKVRRIIEARCDCCRYKRRMKAILCLPTKL